MVGVGDDQGRGGVLDHVGETVDGVARVERDVGGTGLEDAEDGAEQFRAAVQADCDQAVRKDSEPAQVVRQLVRALVDLAVRQDRLGAVHGDGVRGGGHPLLEELVDGGGVGVAGGGAVPLDGELLPLRLGEHVQLGQRGPRCRRGSSQQRPEVSDQTGHRGLVEEVGAVLDRGP